MESLESLETILSHTGSGCVTGMLLGISSRLIDLVGNLGEPTVKRTIGYSIGAATLGEVCNQIEYGSSPPYAVGMAVGTALVIGMLKNYFNDYS